MEDKTRLSERSSSDDTRFASRSRRSLRSTVASPAAPLPDVPTAAEAPGTSAIFEHVTPPPQRMPPTAPDAAELKADLERRFEQESSYQNRTRMRIVAVGLTGLAVFAGSVVGCFLLAAGL